MENINIWAVLTATVASFVLGGMWFSPILFAKPWMQVTGLSEEELAKGNMAKIFGGSFFLTLIMAFNLAAFLGKESDWAWGLTAGLLAGVGWVGTALGVIYLFERRPLKHFLINAGFQAVSFGVMGLILGWWH
ncbi:MAG: DUF1761 domain-containing protein [Acidobacteria bacterium]|nr:DUF1761 domain-containing protein [Acidobacteriota bacterium]